jgi:uncharacterized protein (DUF433 family)
MTSRSHDLEYIVSDPLVCHGKWTFRGTRIFVSDVLDQLDNSVPREVIVKQWRGDVSLAAIEEVARVGRNILSLRSPAA